MRIFFLPSWGCFLLGWTGIFWSLNYFNCYAVTSEPFYFYFPFYFLSSLFSAFLASLWAVSYSFFFFFASAASLFSSFLSCCFDNPILYPSDNVSGSFLPSYLPYPSWASLSWCTYSFYYFCWAGCSAACLFSYLVKVTSCWSIQNIIKF